MPTEKPKPTRENSLAHIRFPAHPLFYFHPPGGDPLSAGSHPARPPRDWAVRLAGRFSPRIRSAKRNRPGSRPAGQSRARRPGAIDHPPRLVSAAHRLAGAPSNPRRRSWPPGSRHGPASPPPPWPVSKPLRTAPAPRQQDGIAGHREGHGWPRAACSPPPGRTAQPRRTGSPASSTRLSGPQAPHTPRMDVHSALVRTNGAPTMRLPNALRRRPIPTR